MPLIKKFILIFLFLLCVNIYTTSFAMENLFYILRSDDPDRISSIQNAVTSLKQNYKSINILVSQAYQINENGIVEGFVNPEVLQFSQQHALKLMALVTNADFDNTKAHGFLTNPTAQAQALQTLLAACQQYHFYGIQFDFEMIPIEDRAALTQFYLHAAEVLHQHGFIVSFAIAPTLTDGVQPSYFLSKIYTNWEAAYDLKALSGSGDFFSLMAYDQHGNITTPGPTASIRWVEATLKYALQFIPPQKISLGIEVSSSYWYTGTNIDKKISMQTVALTYEKVSYLLHKHHALVHWDNNTKNNYSIYQHNWLNEYLFIEDVDSFKAKLELAQKYHLRGISVFDLGTEDPRIWEVLANKSQ